jgi:hypothetical protein
MEAGGCGVQGEGGARCGNTKMWFSASHFSPMANRQTTMMTDPYAAIPSSVPILLGSFMHDIKEEEDPGPGPGPDPDLDWTGGRTVVREEREAVFFRGTYGELRDAIAEQVATITRAADDLLDRVNGVVVEAQPAAPAAAAAALPPSPLREQTCISQAASLLLRRYSHRPLRLDPRIERVKPDFHPAALAGHLGACRAVCRALPAAVALRLHPLPSDTFSSATCSLSIAHDAAQLAWQLSAFAENKARLVRCGVVPALVAVANAWGLHSRDGRSGLLNVNDIFGGWTSSTMVKLRRSLATIAHNVSERAFRTGEANPVQPRIVEEGGAELLLALGRAASSADDAGTDPATRLICALGLAHLSACPGAAGRTVSEEGGFLAFVDGFAGLGGGEVVPQRA